MVCSSKEKYMEVGIVSSLSETKVLYELSACEDESVCTITAVLKLSIGAQIRGNWTTQL